MSIVLDVGTYTEFPSLKPDGKHRRVWPFKNDTDKDWTNIWITTGPQAWYGPFTDPFGGKGNPPNMDFISMKWGNKSFGASNQGEDFHNELSPDVARGDEITITIDFNDGFEEFEYIQFTFSWTDDSGQTGIPVNGSRTVGRDLPSAEAGPVGDAIKGAGSAAGKFIGQVDTSTEQGPGTQAVVVFLGRELDGIKRQVLQLQSQFDRHIREQATSEPSEKTGGEKK